MNVIAVNIFHMSLTISLSFSNYLSVKQVSSLHLTFCKVTNSSWLFWYI